MTTSMRCLNASRAGGWALLAVVGLLVAAGAPQRLRSAIACASLASYAAFLLALNL